MVTSLLVCPNSKQEADKFRMMVTSLSVCPNRKQEAEKFRMMVTSLSVCPKSEQGVEDKQKSRPIMSMIKTQAAQEGSDRSPEIKPGK